MKCEFLTVATFLKKNLSNTGLMHSHPVFCVPSVFLPVFPPSISESGWVRKYWTWRKGNSQRINDCLISADAIQLGGWGSPTRMSKATTYQDAMWSDGVMRDRQHITNTQFHSLGAEGRQFTPLWLSSTQM